MEQIVVNENKLKELIKKYTVEVSFNGFASYNHNVVNARLLLEDLHLITDTDKQEFIKFVNWNNRPTFPTEYKKNELLRFIFDSIKSQGVFKIAGHEALGSDPYIEIKTLQEKININ